MTNYMSREKWLLVSLLLMICCHSIYSQINTTKAILLIDIQEDFTGEEAKMPVNSNQASQMIDNLNALINSVESENVLIIYVGNEFPKNSILNIFRNNAAIEGTEGSDIDNRLRVINNNYFTKHRGNAFTNPNLNHYLKDNGITDVYVSGVYAEACVLATIKGATRLGYDTFILTDCVATKTDKKKAKVIEKYQNKGFETTTSRELILTSISK